MPQSKKAIVINKYKNVCEAYFQLRHEYRQFHQSSLHKINYSIYKQLLRLEQKINKFKSSPHISLSIWQDIQDEAKSSVQSVLCDNKYCDNCLRKQSPYLIENFGDIYRLTFTDRSKEDISTKKKFKFSPRGFSINTFCLCQECDSYLVKEDDKSSKLTKSTWPSFILSTLINKDVISSYGVKA